MFCKFCGNQLLSTARFCGKCGTAVLPATPVAQEEFPCPSCHTANKPGAKFCKSCGCVISRAAAEPAPVIEKVQPAETGPVPPEPVRAGKPETETTEPGWLQQNRSKVVAGIVSIMVIIALGITIGVILSPENLETEKAVSSKAPRPESRQVESAKELPEPPPIEQAAPPPVSLPELPSAPPRQEEPVTAKSPAKPASVAKHKPAAKPGPSEQDKADLEKANRTLDELLKN